VSVCNRIEQAELGYWIHYATSAKISRRILSGGDWKGLLKLIEEVRARVSRETGRTVEVMSCYEAGYDGFWLHRQLEAHGIRNYVIDPASLQVDRRVRRVKTDRIDTERLLRSLMAYLRGEPKVWSVVRVPSVAEEDARRLHRERDRLASERVQHVNRIKGLCALQGIYDYQPLRPQAMARLEQLRTPQGVVLPPRLKSEIKRELHRLELVVEMIASLEAERDAVVEDKASTHVHAKKIQSLDSSRQSARSLPRYWLAKYSIMTSTIAANWRVMSGTRRAHSRAET
jgi:transposase